MESLITVLLWFCALGCGLLAGVYFAFSAFIMTALGGAGHAGTIAMNSINTAILRSPFLPLFLGTTLAAAALAVFGAMELDSLRGRLMSIGALLHVAGMFGVTMAFNVPLNAALAEVGAESRTGNAIWRDYLKRWTRWNHVRTLSCLAATAAFVGALR